MELLKKTQKIKKTTLKKFLIFQEMEHSCPKFKKFLIFFLKKNSLYFRRELAKPEKQKFLIFLLKSSLHISG